MTVIESGTAVNVNYNEDDARAIAIHEAGHAAAAHVYRARARVEPALDQDARQLPRPPPVVREGGAVRRRSRARMFGELIHAVGAMAAEFVFYGENSNGVGGDLQSTTWTAAGMVGAAGMSPLPLDLNGKTFADETEEQTRERVMKRLEDIGVRLMNRTASGWEALQRSAEARATPPSSSARRS